MGGGSGLSTLTADGRRRALAVRHIAFEDLGTLEELLAERGWQVGYVEAAGDNLAAVETAAPELLIVLGGPIGAYQDDDYPFLEREVAIVERRLARGLPTLGICLGAQLMARALGARVYPSGHQEIGWGKVTLSAAGTASCLAPLAATPVLHWHGDTFDLPAAAIHLAATGPCPNQAFARGANALALQFHIEVRAADLERWFVGHAVEIAAADGVTVAALRADTARHGAALETAGRACLERWLDGLEI